MTKNPFLNALAALLYITVVSLVMFYGGKYGGPDNSFIAPVAVLSLFTLSAAAMGYIFLYQPGQLYFEGKRKQGVDLFLKTVAVFAVITAIVMTLLFSGLLSSKKSSKPAAAHNSYTFLI